MLYCNVNVHVGNQFLSGISSTVTYDQVSDLIRIEMVHGLSMSPQPGQHFFLYQPGVLKFWENHPFSLGAWTSASEKVGKKLIFYVRPYDGWTRLLRDQAIKTGGTFQPKLLLEGPYGHTEPLHHFDTNLMVVGGTGIAAAVPYLLSHSERAKKSLTKTSKIHIVWAIRERAMWDQVFTDDLEPLLRHGDITITVYCTKLPTCIPDSNSDCAEAEVNSTPKEKTSAITSNPVNSLTNSGLRFLPGRPNLRELLMTEVNECKNSSSSLCVFTCGPAQMADELRSSVYDTMKHGFHEIEYCEEAFGW